MIVLKISGEPVPRAERISYRRLIDIRKKEKRRIALEIMEQYDGPVLEGAVSVQYTFNLKIPKNLSKRKRACMLSGKSFPTKRPDCSNLVKLIEDVMTGLIYRDDSLIVEGYFKKRWAEIPGTELLIVPISSI